ncbi:hypothetical protein A3E39_04315 [Candidatus Uhrbacteria bacterium RIFCSPHIGHO2_12_FULL_60_25]|uniref:Nucleoside 2-deoxyribosyltransferase n=1 Tax=Candidatus Uhrbacteria bacterium RIFCSPHIGHO2_12_FULL_60_25 TaxID=1802399 RepID=A0A1F7UIN7_9BACT|nr:MAG: hypothetical protein A3D73_00865 [Candidatus Uhrbacteria bacterium RIFCSPHIGHO2_02_FULL_60_44]OGL78113.1 MAG: hypothetical protein A3E39_04315 [Candidatus Uhrbacteria bacterium RIFCSPHIGHO2_12_FULL_60_25]
MGEKRMVYISGALSDMDEAERAKLRTFYEWIGETCEAHGFSVYLPHKYGDPKRNADKTPQQIDQIDRQAVTLSFFMIAYVGIPSIGVGIEIEMAWHANKPVVLIAEQDRINERRVSRLVRGSPSVWHEIGFADHEDAIRQLKEYLPKFIVEFRAMDLPPPISV